MEEFPGNAKNTKKEEKKVEAVVTGEVIRKKPSVGKRLVESFTGDDSQTVASYVLFDVVVPALRDMVADAATQGIERKLYGESRARTRSARPMGVSGGPINYSKFSGSPSVRPPEPRQNRRRTDFTSDDILLATRIEAETVLERLDDLIKKYETASVADLYDLLGITGNPYTDNNWGWSTMRGSGVSRTNQGYMLDLPKPEPLK